MFSLQQAKMLQLGSVNSKYKYSVFTDIGANKAGFNMNENN